MTLPGSRTDSHASSRRALLAGAVGGLGAWAATAIGRPGRAEANDPNDVVLGATNTSGTQTTIQNITNGAAVFKATSNSLGNAIIGVTGSGVGVNGQSGSGVGVLGETNTSTAVYGIGNQGVGIHGVSYATAKPAAVGWSGGNSTGVMGYSNNSSGLLPTAKPNTGVFGYAAQSSSSRGVWGESTSGIGVYGRATNGFAGYFHGKVFTDSFHELLEVATPSAPPANRARLFVRDVGGKTQLCVRFATGSVKLIAQEA